MQFKNRVGEVDPLLFAHYLIGHRHPQALQKAVKSGEVINCKINLRGAHKFKVKDCLKCTLGSCKEKPRGHRTYSTKHASRQDIADTAVQQHQANESLSADSRRYLLSATGFKLAQACEPYAVITLDEITGTGATMIDINGYSTVNNVMVATCIGYNIRHALSQSDMTSSTLYETLKSIIAWVEAHGCRCYVMRFGPSQDKHAPV
jgi:hypothetical protein